MAGAGERRESGLLVNDTQKTCGCCGKPLNELPLELAARLPRTLLERDLYENSPDVVWSMWACIWKRVPKNDSMFFSRGRIEIPCSDHPLTFGLTTWVRLNRRDFSRVEGPDSTARTSEEVVPGILDSVGMTGIPEIDVPVDFALMPPFKEGERLVIPAPQIRFTATTTTPEEAEAVKTMQALLRDGIAFDDWLAGIEA